MNIYVHKTYIYYLAIDKHTAINLGNYVIREQFLFPCETLHPDKSLAGYVLMIIFLLLESVSRGVSRPHLLPLDRFHVLLLPSLSRLAFRLLSSLSLVWN